MNSANFDYNIVEKVDSKSDLMNGVEKKIVFSTLKAIKYNSKEVLANYGQVSNHGVEIISESLKNSDSVLKLDLNSNLISEQGCKAVGDMLKYNLYMKTLKLS